MTKTLNNFHYFKLIYFMYKELEPILRQLDPNGHGKITFEDFCHRVKEITNGKYFPFLLEVLTAKMAKI